TALQRCRPRAPMSQVRVRALVEIVATQRDGAAMKKLFAWVALAAASALPQTLAKGQNAVLPPPGFHHLHLNSVNPDAAIVFYTKQFPTTSKATWNGISALNSPNNVLVLFSKATAPPPV